MGQTPIPDPQLTPLKRAFLAIEQLEARLAASERERNEPIAIVGMGCRFPGGADSPASFWRLLAEGFDGISDITPDRWNSSEYFDPDLDKPGKTCARRVGLVDTINDFDPGFFGISPREAAGMDPQQRMLLEVSWEALEDAGIAPSSLSGSPTGVFVGICGFDLVTLQMKWNDPARIGQYYASGIAHSIASGRLSYLLGLQGPSISIDTACSSSLVAVHLAYQSLRAGDCRLALAGGTHAVLTPEISIALAKARMLAPDGRCKAFDANADGFVEGEGCGIVVLKRLSDARADGDRILAVILGSACNQDGASSGLTVPNGPAQQAVIREALARARVEPAAVSFVETHGTGTPLGDPIEVQALAAALSPGRPPERPIAIGSVKTNIGHLQSAAGVAGLIKTVLALNHRRIPPHLHLEQPNPHVPWSELPVVVPTKLTPWPAGYERLVAGVTSLGFSGTNAHVIVENGPDQKTVASDSDRPLHVLALSAKDPYALDALAQSYAARLESDDVRIADVCFTANAGRSHFGHRLAIVGGERAAVREGLLARRSTDTAAVFASEGAASARQKVAFLFTGQGSQYAGMGQELYASAPAFRAAVERCAAVVDREWDVPLVEVLYGGATARLSETAYAQAALYAVEYGLAEVWRSWGVRPAVVLGHSVGEFVAATVAGVLSVEEGARLVVARGRLMAGVGSDGGMLAVAADEATVTRAVAEVGGAVSIAAVNAADQIVVGGARPAVAAVAAALTAAGVETTWLAGQHGFHSPWIEPMLDGFGAVAAGVRYGTPQVAVISSVTGELVTGDAYVSAGYWRRQARAPVAFGRAAAALAATGCGVAVEVGPKPTLVALAQRTVPGLTGVASLREGRGAWATLLESVATLYTRGAALDWAGFDRPYSRAKVALPTYPFQRQRYALAGPARSFSGTAETARAAEPDSQPFGGRRLRSALKETQFEYRISETSAAFLTDHRKSGAAVFPATAYIAMIHAAARAANLGATAIENFVIAEPLVLDGATTQFVQLVFTPDGTDSASFQILSTTDETPGAAWLTHASGTVRAGAPLAGGIDPEAASSIGGAVDVAAFYDTLRREGHEYGPAFRSIARQWRRDGEAFAEVAAPAAAMTWTDDWGAHPVVLDGCLQAIRATVSEAIERAIGEDIFLPVAFDRIAISGATSPTVWSHAVIRDADVAGGMIVADVRVYDAAGDPIAAFEGVMMRRLRRTAATSSATRGLDDQYRPVWTPADASTSLGPSNRPRSWLIRGDGGDRSAALAARLVAAGDAVRLLDPSDDFEQITAGEARPRRFDGVVVMCTAVAPPEPSIDTLRASARKQGGTVLDVVRALAVRSGDPSRLWIVTRGAQPAGAPRPLDVTSAALWGLARTVAAEHPELRCTRIDLDGVDLDADVDSLCREFAATGDEDQVAYRAGVRHVLRLERADRPQARRPADEPIALEIGERGVLDGLRLVPASRRAPGPDEIEIEVRAAGLNFRDVLNALGVYAGDPAPLGIECAGRIVKVGSGVSDLAVGQDVMTITPDCFRSFVTVPASRVAAVPRGLGRDEAAGAGVALTTAHYALHVLGRMSRGERVLVHAAAGGVGLAAVQIAQQAGAQVFATAGSAEKHAFLRSLGVQHVMSSRTPAFADEIMTLTGGDGVDLVLNSLNGEMIPRSLAALAPKGRFIEIGKAGIWTPEQAASVRPDVRYETLYLSGADDELVGGLLRDIAMQLGDGRLKPLPVRAFPIEAAADAFRYMAAAKHIGKVVLTLPGAQNVPPISADASYLITGGTGALGIETARWMIDSGARHVVVAARRAPSPDVVEAVGRLQARGATIDVVQSDVTSAAEVSALLDRTRAGGRPLRGIVHAAGITDDGVLAAQTEDRLGAVLDPKIAGAWNLHALTRGDTLDFFIAFSSIAAVIPAGGQGPYAAANAFLDSLAHHRRALGLPALSINWGPWATGMTTAVEGANRRRWDDLGIELIEPSRGTRILGELLASADPQVIAFPVDWTAFLRRYQTGGEPPVLRGISRRRTAASPAGSPAPSWLDEIERAPVTLKRTLIENQVQALSLKVLGLDGRRLLDPTQPLREHGLDSLMAVELRNAIAKRTGRTLPATLLFKYPTIAEVTDFLYREFVAPLLPPDATGHVDAAAIADVAALDDDETRRLLARELADLSVADRAG
jgi:acyl transferase domain-containing protein